MSYREFEKIPSSRTIKEKRHIRKREIQDSKDSQKHRTAQLSQSGKN